MFVQSVTKQTGRIKIKNQGWVKTQASIDKLKKAGILEIEIDPDKTLTTPEPQCLRQRLKNATLGLKFTVANKKWAKLKSSTTKLKHFNKRPLAI
ncbi:DUF3391 domain-containing protein [uncultured Pseudoalteromonas sp.]|uniref:DUF3391 domain-containing protein n=1 Tax=uncultured Pseudoalteromonas sp. TaxID=114053 RepID=UPI00338EA2F2